jgi:outer membrane protein TolC
MALINNKTIRIFLICLLGGAGTLYAQPAALSLEQCYELLRAHHPAAQNLPLLEASHRFQMQNLNRQYLPQAQLNAQVTWQSDVTALPIEVPLPGFNIPTISQDQYRATLELRQTLWDGGVNARQKDIQTAGTQVARQSVEVELHQLKNQVNSLYFNVLLADEQQELNNVLQENLQARIQRMEAAVANGAATRANLYSLQAELLKAEQQAISIQANRRSAVASLALLLQQELNENMIFAKPDVNNSITNTEIQRPE